MALWPPQRQSGGSYLLIKPPFLVSKHDNKETLLKIKEPPFTFDSTWIIAFSQSTNLTLHAEILFF